MGRRKKDSIQLEGRTSLAEPLQAQAQAQVVLEENLRPVGGGAQIDFADLESNSRAGQRSRAVSSKTKLLKQKGGATNDEPRFVVTA